MSKIDFLERSFNANNSPKGGEGIWQSPNGLAYDAVGNEVAEGDLVKFIGGDHPKIYKVVKVEDDPEDPVNMDLERKGWECGYEILKVGGPE